MLRSPNASGHCLTTAGLSILNSRRHTLYGFSVYAALLYLAQLTAVASLLTLITPLCVNNRKVLRIFELVIFLANAASISSSFASN